jgi:hypothetical protein
MKSTEKKYKELYTAHYAKVMRLCLGYVPVAQVMKKTGR